MMKIYLCIGFLILLFSLRVFSQDTLNPGVSVAKLHKAESDSSLIVPAKVINGDTIPFVEMYAVTVYPAAKYMSREDLINYQKLVYRVRKVYPYAKLAAKKLEDYRKTLDSIPSNRGKRKFIKKAQKELENQFEDEIKKLSFSQGKILIKLIYRETGNSTYDIVKELRGGFNAFIWQSMAGLFGYDLKTGFDPDSGEDQMIEKIVEMIDAGNL